MEPPNLRGMHWEMCGLIASSSHSFLWDVTLHHSQMNEVFLRLYLEGSNLGTDKLISLYILLKASFLLMGIMLPVNL